MIVSAIGGPALLADASRSTPDTPARMLTGALAQGLVRFDASGQIEPGAAERWIVIDEGMTYIFRLRGATWSDGRPVAARDVVTILKRQIAPGSRNPIAPYLTAIDDVVEMTPEVIEVRLKRPRPDLLKLFAQPEMAILRVRPPGGSGPFRVAAHRRRAWLLVPAPDLDRAVDEVEAPTAEDQVRLIGERAARAITRFATRDSDMVGGGTVTDWPLVALAKIAPNNIRIDPAAGLFGLAIVDRGGFLATADNRTAIAQALDRAALASALSANWPIAEQILPEQLDSAAAPVIPAWSAASQVSRRAAARRSVAAWRAANTGTVTVRIALPNGPGGTLLWGRLAADLLAIGVSPERVGWNAPADLRLIDSVAPYDSARWYLSTACAPCGPEANTAIEAARTANSVSERAQALAQADIALDADVAFIPLARPLRWSLVSLRLRNWQANARAWHPLNHLRRDTRSRQ